MFVSCVCESVLFMTVCLLHNYVCHSVLLMIVCLHHNYVCHSVYGFCSKCLSGCSFDLHFTSSVNIDAVGVFVCPYILTCLRCIVVVCLIVSYLFRERHTEITMMMMLLLLKSNDSRETLYSTLNEHRWETYIFNTE